MSTSHLSPNPPRFNCLPAMGLPHYAELVFKPVCQDSVTSAKHLVSRSHCNISTDTRVAFVPLPNLQSHLPTAPRSLPGSPTVLWVCRRSTLDSQSPFFPLHEFASHLRVKLNDLRWSSRSQGGAGLDRSSGNVLRPASPRALCPLQHSSSPPAPLPLPPLPG